MSKPKIKKVIRTKVPTLTQIQNMCTNLRYKLNMPVNIEIYTWYMSHIGNPKSQYNIYLSNEDPGDIYLETWSELQDKYFSLMES